MRATTSCSSIPTTLAFSTLLRLVVMGVLATSLSVLAPGGGVAASAAVFVDDRPAPSWGVNGRVYATKVVGNTVFVGGSFSAAVAPNGQLVARRNLAAFDMSTGALRTAWRAGADSTVRALESDGAWLYVGGSFGRVDGQARQRLAKIGVASGQLDPGFQPRVNNAIRALDLHAGSLYAGGFFTAVNGTARRRVAKIATANGSLDRSFTPAANRAVWGLAVSPHTRRVYLSGPFSTINGVSRNGVAGVNSSTGALDRTVFGSAARPTLGLAVNADGTRLYGAGATGTNTLAAWDTGSGVRVWRHVAMGDIQVVEFYRGTVYFGFHDGFQRDDRIKLLAADAGTGRLDPDFRPHINRFWGVWAIDVSDRGVVAGGEFTQVSGTTARGWVRFPTG